jgi:hypothetical protein
MTTILPGPYAPLKIVVDEPTKSLGLGYNEYVDALASVVIGENPPDSLSESTGRGV